MKKKKKKKKKKKIERSVQEEEEKGVPDGPGFFVQREGLHKPAFLHGTQGIFSGYPQFPHQLLFKKKENHIKRKRKRKPKKKRQKSKEEGE